MPNFKSLAILDLETTGLPSFEHKTKITELAIIACETSHILLSPNRIPRVLHKIVLCFNPRRKITFGAIPLTDLDNELLEHAGPFSKEVREAIGTVLNRLPGPVCLIAHNGYNFDFPILRKEFGTCEDVYCADSLRAFRALYPKPKASKCAQNTHKKLECRIKEEFDNSEIDLYCIEAWDSYEGEKLTMITPSKSERQIQNETTPKANIVPRNYLPFRRNLNEQFEAISDKNPLAPSISENIAPTSTIPTLTALKSYKLCDIFSFLHDGAILNGHRAEEDALALLSCIVRSQDKFLPWVEENSVLFNTINPK